MRFSVSRASLTKAALLFAIWTSYGLLSGLQSHYWYSFSKNPLSWSESLRYEMTYAYLWGACCPAILWLSNRFRIERDRRRASHVFVHVAVMTVFVILTKTLFELIAWPPESAFSHFTWQKLFRSIEVTADTGVLLYWMIILVEHAFVYYK